MIRCSIIEKYADRVGNILNEGVKELLESIFKSKFNKSQLREQDLEVMEIDHLFPGSFACFKSKKELLNILLEVKDIMLDNAVRLQLKPLYIYVLYQLNSGYYELKKDTMVDSDDLQESKIIPEGVKKFLSKNTELSQEEKDDISLWFTEGLEDDICDYYDHYNIDDYISFGWNEFENIAQTFLENGKITQDALDILEEGMCFVAKDIADLCLEKIKKGKYSIIEGDLEDEFDDNNNSNTNESFNSEPFNNEPIDSESLDNEPFDNNIDTLTKEKLIKLYAEKGLTRNQIADMYKVKKSKIDYLLKKWDINLKSKVSNSVANDIKQDIGKEKLSNSLYSLINNDKAFSVEELSRALVDCCFTNGPIEDMYDEGKLSQEDMKILNKFCYNKIHTFFNLLLLDDKNELCKILK